MKLFQKGWNYLQDGPGNRLVYHMQGCNLRCPWCANPEGIPKAGARKTKFRCFEMTPAEIVAEADGARHLFHDGGGVTFSGGEPLVQFDELRKTLALLKRRKIHTALETNASSPRLPALFNLVDYLIVDLKHPDNKAHRAMLGVGNAAVVGNIKAAARDHSRVLVRITLVPGFNDSARDAARFVRLLAPLKGGNLAVEFLRYHEYGRVKWEQCGLEYKMKKVTMSRNAEKRIRSAFAESGVNVIKT